ncbi:regulator of g-protein signaling 9-binding protein [Limosa lapponica baueri]|uniref:Regulator of g-protein signaling 9-binding protein n=2 Tax=Neoaves TaxID=3078114 RepID=A0A2I0U1W2_LIMLA|nr:regulator of g-protein signaling 9-binding protein [Limosa lapponica baueri]
MVKEECKALLDALNKVTACYRHMVLTIGGTSDSQNLREELKKTRQKAQELAVANRNKLTTVLKDKTVSKEDKAEFERLWVIFSTCLEILEIDMRRALELGHEFPLNVPKKHLIQTGMSGGTSGVAARAMSVQNMKYEAEHNIDVVDLKDLENEINQVGEMMYEMEMKVNVPQWTVEAKQDPGAELKSTISVGASSIGMISVEENKSFCDISKVLAGIIFSAVLIIAIVLAVCVWSSPPEAIERFKSQEIWFAPPQFYELCRLCNFSSLHELHQFSSDRALEGCERWMPVMLTASDGYIQLLPGNRTVEGDELYPEDPDYTGEKKVIMSTDKKVEDLMKEGSVFHRIVIKDINNLAVYVNIQAKYKHKNPVMIDSHCSDYNSRL